MTIETQTTNDIYSTITNRIIADLEKGQLTWRQPWMTGHDVMRPLRWNDQPYTSVNTILLWDAALNKGFESSHWMTFKQALALKGSVRKGEKATQIVYADKFLKEEIDAQGETQSRTIPFLKSYHVFNANQIDGLSDGFYKKPNRSIINLETRDERLENYFAETKIAIQKGTKACYNLSRDVVEIPAFENFYDAPSYYATLAHEIVHATKHPTRLDREFGRLKWGDEGYAKEELVAELGSCFLAADLGFEPEFRQDHSAYIQNWLQVLQNDKRFIFSAASYAQKAVEYLHSLQPK
jgi:antirestriction protein ArdC